MFNFSVMNRALTDTNVTDKEFRMLYAIDNYCSLKNSNTVEIYNAQLMLILNVSERWVRNLTNQLVTKGYISKEVKGTSKNKQANIYTLLEVEVNNTPTNLLCNENDAQKFPLKDDKNVPLTNIINDTEMIHKSDAQKFPLKNNNKINKNNIIYNIPDDIIPVEEDKDINKSGDISIQEEIELDELINNIPTIKEIMSKNNQDNITEATIPTIEEKTETTIVNPNSINLTFPVNISGQKQEINLNVEVNDINSLTHSEISTIYTNLKYQIFLLVPEVLIDGYWTKDCYNSYPSPYEFEHSLLPDAIGRYKLIQGSIKSNSAPAPAENVQECATIASNAENDKEYNPTQENATGAKTEPNMDVITNKIAEDTNKFAELYSNFFCNVGQEAFDEMKSVVDRIYSNVNETKSDDVWNEFEKNVLNKLAIAENYLTLSINEYNKEMEELRMIEEEKERIELFNNSEHSTMECLCY